jgi:hypothetical protein
MLVNDYAFILTGLGDGVKCQSATCISYSWCYPEVLQGDLEHRYKKTSRNGNLWVNYLEFGKCVILWKNSNQSEMI